MGGGKLSMVARTFVIRQAGPGQWDKIKKRGEVHHYQPLMF
jgi:hypothetical protein